MIECSVCGANNGRDRRDCFKCSAQLTLEVEEGEQAGKKKGISPLRILCLILMVLAVPIGFQMCVHLPGVVAARAGARTKACMANIKMLENGLEMYDMDIPPNDLDGLTTVVFGCGECVLDYPLNKGGYAQRFPKCPSTGSEKSYSVLRDSKQGWALYVKCEVHNTVAAPNRK